MTTAALTYVLVVVGGMVRATGSGLGCGNDWPRCNGRLIPPFEYHVLVEYAHRLTASLVILATIVLAVTALTTMRGRRGVVGPAVATVPIVFSQAILGAIVVKLDLKAESVVAHLLVAMSLLAVLITVLINTGRAAGTPAADRRFARSAAVVAGGALVLMLVGSYVSGRGAGLAFTDWPLFGGRVLPTGAGDLGALHGIHRILAAVVGVGVVLLARAAGRTGQSPAIVRLTKAAMHAYLLQVVVGAGNVWTRLSPVTRTAHLALGAAIWGLLFAAASLARRLPAPDAPPSTVSGVSTTGLARARAYFALTKPRIIELLLVTTVPAMVLADRGLPPVALVLATVLGGALAAGGANTINCYIDRDIDEKMHRTHGRPLPMGDVTPVQALRFGIILEVIAFAYLWWAANLLAASLAVGATLFYVFVYTMWLKRTTTQNIVIGGAAGAVPVLVGWAAVTGSLALPAWIMFAIIFIWTPPHFWALAVKYRDDYAAAGVPMLPVVAGLAATARQILGYSVALVAVTLLLWPAARMGALYIVASIALGLAFVRHAVRLLRDVSPERAVRLFSYSITYLGLLFAAIALDTLVRRG